MDVLVLEAHPERAGGAVGSEAATRPGFVHDVGAAFFPWGALSPAFRALPLEHHGLHWRWAPIQSCHPAPDGSVASILREPDRHDAAFGGDARDEEQWRRVAEWYRGIEPDVIGLLMGPFPSVTPLRRLGVAHAGRLGRIFASSGRGLAERWFRSPEARRVLPSLALHADVGPDDRFGAAPGVHAGHDRHDGGLRRARRGRARHRRRAGRVPAGAGRRSPARRPGRARGGPPGPSGGGPAGGSGRKSATRVILADTDVASLLLDLAREAELPGGSRAFSGATRGAGAPSRWTGRSTARSPGPQTRAARAPSSTPATASTTSRASPARSGLARCPSVPIW